MSPGCILLVRRQWYLSNIGIPGFWPHAVLYVGTFLDHVQQRRGVWICRRIDIARHWIARHPYRGDPPAG
jgi:hypothetical protein